MNWTTFFAALGIPVCIIGWSFFAVWIEERYGRYGFFVWMAPFLLGIATFAGLAT